MDLGAQDQSYFTPTVMPGCGQPDLGIRRSQKVRSLEICLGNQVRDLNGQAEHETRKLAGSGIHLVRPEAGQVSGGSGRVRSGS